MDILELESPVYPEYQPVPDLFATVSPCRPTRYVVDLNSKSLIERQVLDTRGDEGYAIYDINQGCDAALIRELEQIPHTIRVRAAGSFDANPCA